MNSITIQKTDDLRYLVSLKHTFGNQETLDFAVAIPMGNHTLSTANTLALQRVAALVQQLLTEVASVQTPR
jgi:hypothetical protein